MNKLFNSLCASAAILTCATAQAQNGHGHTGPGTTRQSGVPMTPMFKPPVTPRHTDPTQGLPYRAANAALPIVKGIRNCSGGAVAGFAFGTLRGSPAVGAATGCAGALNPNLSKFKPLPVY